MQKKKIDWKRRKAKKKRNSDSENNNNNTPFEVKWLLPYGFSKKKNINGPIHAHFNTYAHFETLMSL